MTVEEFAARVPGFATFSHAEKIRLLAWHLHVHQQRIRFSGADIKKCYEALHLPTPSSFGPYIAHLIEKKPPDLLRDSQGYRLTGPLRASFDSKYGKSEAVIAVEEALVSLPDQVTNIAEKTFLVETLTCYRNKAFRAAIVMAWNLAYDHLLDWLLSDATRLAAFNARLPLRFPKKAPLVVSQKEHFEELKEFEVIQVCVSAKLFSGNIEKILNEKLARRNIAAHPSTVDILQYQADDVITDLVNNVVLRLQ